MGFIALLGIQQAQAKAPFDECDRLTKHPFDKRGLGDGVDFSKLDADRAIKACENAVNSYPNEPRFQFQLGRAFDKKKQYETAIRWYKKVAKDYSYPSAQNNLGHMYRGGKGVPQDDKTAVKWYRLAAEQGDAVGQNALGNMYYTGRGVPKDGKESAKWRTLAAEQGNSQSQYNLGVMYENGRGVSQDDKTAVKWYRLAAEQGIANAQRALKRLQKEIAKLNKLRELQARAKQGDANAQYQLGTMYDNGLGVPKDDKEAVKWWRKAAKQGFAQAQSTLGVMYYFGEGVSVNSIKAYMWWSLAMEQGNELATKNLKIIKEELSSAEISIAQELAIEMWEKINK